MFDAVAALPAGEAEKERKSLFRNMVHSLNHNYVIDRIWQAHLEGRDHGYETRNTKDYPPLPELWRLQQEVNAWYIAWSDKLSDAALDEQVRFTLIGGNQGLMTRGEILWQIAHGETPDDIKNHPLLKGREMPRTGQAGSPGTLVTKTLLVSGERLNTTTPEGVGAMLRAYDKATGREVGAVYMPAPQSGSPMTYMHGGEQYLVVAISGAQHAGELLALKLPRR